MRSKLEKLVSCAQAAALLAAAFCLAGANDPKKERNYLGGKADAVSGWGAGAFQEAKTAGKPLCIYIYDPKYDRNNAAKHFEAVLGSTEVREQLRACLCVKLRSDGSDNKGWPGDWLGQSHNGAVLVVATSDFAQKSVYDKGNKETIGAASLAAQLKGLVKYEEERKALVAKMRLSPGPQSAPPTVPAQVSAKAEKPPLGALEDRKVEKKPEKRKTVDGPADE